MEAADFWVQVVTNNGFAMALTIYLLTSFRKTLEDQRNDFKTFVQEITQAIKELRKDQRE